MHGSAPFGAAPFLWPFTNAVAQRLDPDGYVDIEGYKVFFGKKGADGQWESAGGAFLSRSFDDVEKQVRESVKRGDELSGKWFTMQNE